MPVNIPLTPGEVADRLLILNLKVDRISDPVKKQMADREWALVEQAWCESDYYRRMTREATMVWEDLAACNERLWNLEDEVRSPSIKDNREMMLAIYRCITAENDLRSSLKNTLNRLLGSDQVEVKQHGKS